MQRKPLDKKPGGSETCLNARQLLEADTLHYSSVPAVIMGCAQAVNVSSVNLVEGGRACLLCLPYQGSRLFPRERGRGGFVDLPREQSRLLP